MAVYEQIKKWSKQHPQGRAYLHHFLKTTLQHARRGEDINRQVAADARLGEEVMLAGYVKETDDEMRARSNRMYFHILASLPSEVAQKYGHHIVGETTRLEREIQAAIGSRDWGRVAELSARLAECFQSS